MTTIEKIRTAIINEYNNNTNDMDWSYRAGLAKALDIIKEHAEQEPTIPCDLCRFNPPSSCDGKPCTMCPAEKGGAE